MTIETKEVFLMSNYYKNNKNIMFPTTEIQCCRFHLGQSNSKFPPNLWAQLPSLDSKRTTNAAESFHAHYNEQFYAAHQTILAFLDVITKIQITTYIKIRTLHQPAVVRHSEMDKLTFLMEQYAKYQNGERNRHQYIKAIGFKYSARTDV
jgi:hypothetical protein